MMMTKYATLIALLGVMTICWAQSSSYQYSAVLDTEGEFLMRWNIWPVQKDVEMRFEVKTQGWLSLLLASADASYADVFFGGYDDANSKGYLGDYHFNLTTKPEGGISHLLPEEDASQDLVFQSATFADGLTTLVIKRSQNTGDRDDVPIVCGPMLLGWSFNSASDSPADAHTKGGFATITLVQC